MKLLNKKNLQLNVQGLGYNLMPPQNGHSLSQSQVVKMQQTTHNGAQQQQQYQYHPLTSSAPLLQGQQPSMLQQKLYFKDKMTKVIEGIYVGNYLSAMDQNALQRENITHIINCSPSDCPNLFEQSITYLNINIQDNWKTNLFLVIYIILDFLRDALQQNGRVLIHCNQGISRSPSIVIAYLIYTEKINANIALEKLKKKYPYADPNLDFQIQLNEMYKEVVEEEELQRSRILNSATQTDALANNTSSTSIITNPSAMNASTRIQVSSLNYPSTNGYLSTEKNRSLLNKQVMSNSSHITISTPDLPKQKLNYNSYIQMQSKSLNRKLPSSYNQVNQIEGSNQSLFAVRNSAPITNSANLSNPSVSAFTGNLDTIAERKEKQIPSLQQQGTSSPFSLMPDLSCLKNQSELSIEQKQMILFKRTDSQNGNTEESDLDSPLNQGSSLENKYFLTNKISKSTKDAANESNLQTERQDKKESLTGSMSLNSPQISAKQALQMSSHSHQDANCDENTEILVKSPSPIKKNNTKNSQCFDDKDDELKNKLSDSDIDPLDSTDIQDFNTDTSASFSFDVSSSSFNNVKSFKAHPISAKSSSNQSAQTSSVNNSQYTAKIDSQIQLPCSIISS